MPDPGSTDRGPAFSIDFRALAAFRIGLATLLLIDLMQRAFDLEAHYTDLGVVPRAKLFWFRVADIEPISLHALSGDFAWQAILFVAAAGAAVALGLGFHTRLATFASWFLLVSLEARNPMILNGGDIVLRLLLFWSLFLPLGSRLALDVCHRTAISKTDGAATGIRSVGSAVLLLQVALVYPVAALFKWREPVWTRLEAFEAAMSVDGVATPLGQALASLPSLPAILTATGLGLESFGVLLVFSPWATKRLRLALPLAFMAFHIVGIASTFRIGIFPFVMFVAWLPFLPYPFWDAVERLSSRWRPSRQDGVRITSPSEEHSESGMRWTGAHPASDFLAGALGLCVLLHNGATLGWIAGDAGGTFGWTRSISAFLALDQHWSMWSDPPSNRYFVIVGETPAGQQIDLRRNGQPVDWSSPSWRSRNARWWKLELSLSKAEFEPIREGYGCHWLSTWNRDQRPEMQVDSIEGWMLEGSRSAVMQGEGRRLRLWAVETSNDEPSGCSAVRIDRASGPVRIDIDALGQRITERAQSNTFVAIDHYGFGPGPERISREDRAKVGLQS